MNDEGLIEESKALTATGVSAQTLKRFVETGYLSCETRDGTLCYNTSELQALFDLESACLNNLQSPATEVSQAELPAAEIESEVEIDPLSTSSPTDTILSTPSEPIETDASREKELQRLSILNEMYEKLLDRREQEIKDLHEQRAWLRERIEKLEQKAERDQLLLISETQLITKLVKQKETSSPVKKALVWLGLVTPEKEKGSGTTIEFNKAQNED